jgi:predicted small secreted protein
MYDYSGFPENKNQQKERNFMMKKAYLFVALVVLFSLALSACGGGGGGGDDAASAGKELFAQSVIGTQAGCSTCHSLEEGVVIVGPSMAGIGSRAATQVAGTNAEDYLRQSILEPDAHLVEGFPAGTMPQVWGDELTEEQISNLIAYMLTLK